MPDLSFEVTPPRPGIDLATLSPRSFIEHPKMLSPFKRKSSLLLTASDQKKLRLDPSICPEDSTIMDYFNRTHNLLSKDREKLIINLPFTAPLNRIKEDLKDLRNKNDNLEEKLQNLQSRSDELQSRFDELDDRRLNMFIGNLLVRFIEVLCERRNIAMPEGAGNDKDHTKTRYEGAAEMIKRERWTADYGLPAKYYKTLLNFPKYNATRNITAHETEVDFAKLLLTEHYINTHSYYHWGGLFPFCYGKSVEEMASYTKEMPEMIDEVTDDEETEEKMEKGQR